MTALEKMRDFVGSYPGADILSEFRIDYTDQIPSNGGLFPSGLVEISRRSDILGNATVTNQYNFGLYCNLERAPGDDVQATINADWLMGFQEWVQAQSIQGLAPVFGDDPKREHMIAQNGVLYGAEDDGIATYMVQLSVQFVKLFQTTDPWFR